MAKKEKPRAAGTAQSLNSIRKTTRKQYRARAENARNKAAGRGAEHYCPRGHYLSKAVTYWRTEGCSFNCRRCNAIASEEYRERRARQ